MNQAILKSYIKEHVRSKLTDLKKYIEKNNDLFDEIEPNKQDALLLFNHILHSTYTLRDYIFKLIDFLNQYFSIEIEETQEAISFIRSNVNLIDENFILEFIEHLKNNLDRSSDIESRNEYFLVTDFMRRQGLFGLSNLDATKRSFMDAEVISNRWLIHYTFEHNAEKIFTDGFRRGMSDHKNLFAISEKDYENLTDDDRYIFSFDATRLDFPSPDEVHYGDGHSAIMFRSSGIKSHNKYDDEDQIISLSNDARDIVLLTADEYGSDLNDDSYDYDPSKLKWSIHAIKGYESSNLPMFNSVYDCARWVMQNYNQYRKVLSVR
jgi:hypothetical protein